MKTLDDIKVMSIVNCSFPKCSPAAELAAAIKLSTASSTFPLTSVGDTETVKPVRSAQLSVWHFFGIFQYAHV